LSGILSRVSLASIALWGLIHQVIVLFYWRYMIGALSLTTLYHEANLYSWYKNTEKGLLMITDWV